MKPSVNITDYGMWLHKVITDDFVNMTGLEIAKDQLIQLYFMLYPFIAAEFVHREDMLNWATKMHDEHKKAIDELNNKIDTLVSEMQKHIHVGNMGSPTGPSIDSSMSPIQYTQPKHTAWKTMPEDKDYKYGEKQVTEDSSYTNGIKHKNPEEDSKNYTPEIDNIKEFNDASKFIPVDIDDTIDTGDNEFINQGT